MVLLKGLHNEETSLCETVAFSILSFFASLFLSIDPWGYNRLFLSLAFLKNSLYFSVMFLKLSVENNHRDRAAICVKCILNDSKVDKFSIRYFLQALSLYLIEGNYRLYVLIK